MTRRLLYTAGEQFTTESFRVLARLCASCHLTETRCCINQCPPFRIIGGVFAFVHERWRTWLHTCASSGYDRLLGYLSWSVPSRLSLPCSPMLNLPSFKSRYPPMRCRKLFHGAWRLSTVFLVVVLHTGPSWFMSCTVTRGTVMYRILLAQFVILPAVGGLFTSCSNCLLVMGDLLQHLLAGDG